MKSTCIFLLAAMFVMSGLVTAFAEEASGQEPKKEVFEVRKEVVDKTMPAYRYDLERLMNEAKKNIEKVDKKLQEKEPPSKKK